MIDLSEPGVYHCWSRCVRRAFLCGSDRRTARNFEYRRDWIETRVAELAQWFGIQIAFFAIMQNHFHLVLCTLPQVVARWSDQQVLKRCAKIFPYKFKELGVTDGHLTQRQLRGFASDLQLMTELRSRLSDPSWFLRQLKQNIATRANREENTTGHFFEGRFKSRVVTDEAGLLICGLYVDLNQVRAREAANVSDSRRTSGYRREQGLRARRRGKPSARWDAFLAPVSTRGDKQKHGYRVAGALGSQRVSDKGLLEMSLEEYLDLLRWICQHGRSSHRTRRAAKAPSILERFGLPCQTVISCVEQFESLFQLAVGRHRSLQKWAIKMGRRRLRGSTALAGPA